MPSKNFKIFCCYLSGHLAVDCIWAEWSKWTDCPQVCVEGGANTTRYRTKEEHDCGGKSCEGPDVESKRCHIVPIMEEEVAELKDMNKLLNDSLSNNEKTIKKLREQLCALLNCENGGTCNNDACICPEGFSGVHCEVNENSTPETTTTVKPGKDQNSLSKQ